MSFCFYQICSGDGLPELICSDCVEEVNRAYIFKQQCEKNDAALRESVTKIEIDDEEINNFDGNIDVDGIKDDPEISDQNTETTNVSSGQCISFVEMF